jgi:hypothetical protein
MKLTALTSFIAAMHLCACSNDSSSTLPAYQSLVDLRSSSPAIATQINELINRSRVAVSRCMDPIRTWFGASGNRFIVDVVVEQTADMVSWHLQEIRTDALGRSAIDCPTKAMSGTSLPSTAPPFRLLTTFSWCVNSEKPAMTTSGELL